MSLKETFKCSICDQDFKISEAGKSNRIRKFGKFESICSSCLRKKSNIEKYGVDNPMKVPRLKEKLRETMIEKYGVENLFSDKEYIKEKIKSKYGVDNPMKVESIKNKCVESNIRNHGGIFNTQTGEYKRKARETNIFKYGVDNPMRNSIVANKNLCSNRKNHGGLLAVQTKEVKEKTKETCFKKYGVSNPSKYPPIIEKAKISDIEKYGCDSNQRHFSKEVRDLISSRESFEAFLNEHILDPTLDVCQLLNMTPPTFFSYVRKYSLEHLRKVTRSSFETSIERFLESLNVKFVCNKFFKNSKGKRFQLDFYLPDFNLAIECDGVYWHACSERGKLNPNYHLIKTEECEKLGIQLLHIFDTEWHSKPEIVKDVIRRHLNKTNVCYAEDFKVKELNDSEYGAFLNQNHIQGSTHDEVRLGLLQRNEIYAVMGFSKFTGNADWELTRYCELLGYHIEKGDEKLLNYFEREFKGTIISFCDRRYFSGNFLLKLGFTFIENFKPARWYFTNGKLFEENKIELKNAIDTSYMIVFDCGQKVYIKETKSC